MLNIPGIWKIYTFKLNTGYDIFINKKSFQFFKIKFFIFKIFKKKTYKYPVCHNPYFFIPFY